MQITGIGTDIVEIERIAEICRRLPKFETRVFTQAELKDCSDSANRFQRLAARFAAKEAVAKAFGRSFSWQDVEMRSEASGKPFIKLYGQAMEAAGASRVLISVSHAKAYATAVAIVVNDQPNPLSDHSQKSD